MRIVGGSLRGRTIEGPRHDGLRPTSDRVREAVFNILAHSIDGFDLDGIKVLDLFAGTGALGLEAMSRGARYALFVDDSAEARGLLRTNIENMGLTGQTRIFRRDATDLGPAGRNDGFGLVFADPPYGEGQGPLAIAGAGSGGWLLPGAIAVLEDRAGIDAKPPPGFAVLDRRQWGDTEVAFWRYGAATTITTQGE